MMRLFLLLWVGCIAAYAPHQGPDVNCFDFVSRGSASLECRFEPLGASDGMARGHG